MTGSSDPWRTLGLPPGSSIDEIRRAYRRLAKANHPDAAGESALPRFLAIQSAYEALAGPQRGRRPGARPGSSPSREPWRADPERASATGGASGSTDGRRRPPPGTRPGTTRGAGSPAGAGAETGGAPEAGPNAGRTRRPGGRRRQPNTATPGSTSYDAADEEPFEPGWSGATWYGASSGTYWTINPKEYADPRKHGPEYQRRARRSASGAWIVDPEPGSEPGEDPGAAPDVDETVSTQSGPAARAGAQQPPRRAETVPPVAPQRPSWTSAGREPGEQVRGAPAPEAGGPSGRLPRQPLAPRDDGLTTPLPRLPTTPAGRLGLALLGWPPLGVAVAAAIGESTGCGRFAASCAEVFSPGTWIVQVAIVLLLFALPRVAGWSAVGTLVALAAAIPTAVALSAGGGSRQPEASAGVLAAVLGLAYVVGVGWAITRRWWPGPGGRRVP